MRVAFGDYGAETGPISCYRRSAIFVATEAWPPKVPAAARLRPLGIPVVQDEGAPEDTERSRPPGLGCGRYTPGLVREWEPVRIDSVPAAIEAAARRRGGNGLSYVVGDVTRLLPPPAVRRLRSWTLQEPQIDRRKYHDNSDVHDQPVPEVAPEEQDVHADHDGYHREHVKRGGYPVSHRFILVSTAPARLPCRPRLIRALCSAAAASVLPLGRRVLPGGCR
jgi:hypothetical protein